MLGRLIRGALILLLLVVAFAAAGLVWMHLTVQGQRGPLPLAGELMDLSKESDLPIKVSVIETAEQVTPRRAVLDPTGDPTPDATYVMTHPSFVLEWADGRLLLIDAGMTRDGAIKFGQPLETLMGAGPVTPLKAVALALDKDVSRVKGMVFTHLHLDHVDGVRDLCPRLEKPVKVFMTGGQLDTWTLFTSEGKDVVLHSGCTEPMRIGPGKLIPLEGFPGVAVIHAAGHTPGSQVIVAAVRDQAGTLKRYVFSGDVTNTIDGIHNDLSKPLFYRLVIVPEDDDRLGELRRYLNALEHDLKMAVVPSHDQNHLHMVGIQAWGS